MADLPGVVSVDRAVDFREKARADGKLVVFTNGCFDIIHRGHVELLKEASSFGDYLFVGLNSDNSVKRLKGEGRPLVPQEDRAIVLESLRCVSGVVVFDEDTPLQILEKLRPDILVKGGDYRVNDVVGRDVVEGEGGKVIIVPYIEGYSTSSLINSIKRSAGEESKAPE
jgi:D-beta-D-heptose 7-phosphate kinase/D-beta-D-heptose 1-phosphate adenosyltransferase